MWIVVPFPDPEPAPARSKSEYSLIRSSAEYLRPLSASGIQIHVTYLLSQRRRLS